MKPCRGHSSYAQQNPHHFESRVAACFAYGSGGVGRCSTGSAGLASAFRRCDAGRFGMGAIGPRRCGASLACGICGAHRALGAGKGSRLPPLRWAFGQRAKGTLWTIPPLLELRQSGQRAPLSLARLELLNHRAVARKVRPLRLCCGLCAKIGQWVVPVEKVRGLARCGGFARQAIPREFDGCRFARIRLS